MAVYLNNKLVGFNNIIDQSDTIVTPLTITAEGTYTAPSGTAYSPITVTVGDKLKASVIRPDAELIQSYTNNSLIVTGESVTIPAYATSATTMRASKNLTPTITLNYNNYNYYLLMRMITTPIYNTDTTNKGRYEYSITSYLYELKQFPVSFPSLVGNKTYTNSNYVTFSTAGVIWGFYWSSATNFTIYTSSTYGISQIPSAPAISNGVMTVKSPYINFRGHTTYYTQTYHEALTDVRMQYVIDVYRAPKNNLPVDGWGSSHEMLKLMNCVNNNFTLV